MSPIDKLMLGSIIEYGPKKYPKAMYVIEINASYNKFTYIWRKITEKGHLEIYRVIPSMKLRKLLCRIEDGF